MKKEILFVLVCLCVLPLAFAMQVYKPLSLEIVDNAIDVNGSNFDVNFAVDYPNTAVMSINNYGDANLLLQLVGGYTQFQCDQIITQQVNTFEVENSGDLTIDSNAPTTTTVSIKNNYVGNYVANLDVEGTVTGELGIKYDDMGVRPNCSVSLRGQTWFTFKGSMYEDEYTICKKDRYGYYNWFKI